MAENIQHLIAVFYAMDVHKHCPAGISRIGEKHMVFLPAVELVDQPCINSAECRITSVT